MIIRIIAAALFILASILVICIVGFFSSFYSESSENNAPASVFEYDNGPQRNGVYVDSTLTKSAAATFHVDPTFQAQLDGAIYAQLLYVVGGAKGRDIIIAVSEENNVAALEANTGKTVGERNLGTPVPLIRLPCGNISHRHFFSYRLPRCNDNA